MMDNQLNEENLPTSSLNFTLELISNTTLEVEPQFCGDNWAAFWAPYNASHTILATIACFIGCLTNILNIYAFCRPEMRSPTNNILMALAFTDFLFVFSGFIFIPTDLWAGGWCKNFGVAIIGLVNEICFMLWHTMSCYMMVLLAFWRLLGVVYPLKCKIWWTYKAANLATLAVILTSVTFVTLMYFNHHACDLVNPAYRWFGHCKHICSTLMGAAIFDWTRAIGIKILPCILLIVATTCLVISLGKVENNRAHLRKRRESSNPAESYRNTNRMLVAILIIFLVTELPPGILALVTSIVGPKFYQECQSKVFRFTGLMEYMSSTSNFFVYLIMMRKFRLIFIRGVSRFFPVSTTGSASMPESI